MYDIEEYENNALADELEKEWENHKAPVNTFDVNKIIASSTLTVKNLDLSETQMRILRALEVEDLNTEDLANKVYISKNWVCRRCKELVAKGYVVVEKTRIKGKRIYTYSLSEKFDKT